ncbi:MAG TPA: hypothetical protein DHW71_07440 [Gammaproteobacteria bacterium]|nr:hypothetical protein [Gammaproteobacteria bacterium]HBF06850.1 hypothetical protein [Gammaproteobacteria bacterium]HCK92802.1 hypothetical protein [Gammaproteobacteria bacterium]|tara:strand:+ start:12708 stop:13631 length:924 start_codon:yes stop_codon:yes gene_type:complete
MIATKASSLYNLLNTELESVLMIKSVRYETFNEGQHLVVLGAVHGNEKCGTAAIERLMAALDSEKLVLKKGTLTCVPITNPRAYEENVRFCERNLNRALYVKDEPQHYEDQIDPILCHILEQADVLIDLHSYASEGGLFSFLGVSNQTEIDFCRHLTVQNFVYGWGDAFAQVLEDPRDAMGTVEYARLHGAIATTIECGQHLNADAADKGFQVLLAGLSYLEMIDAPKAEPVDQRFVKMHSVFMKEEEGEFAQPWKHYDEVSEGQLLATYASGKEVRAPQAGFIVLPKTHATVGTEWIFFGVGTDCP